MIADIVILTSWLQLAIAVIGLIMALTVFDNRRHLRELSRRSRRRRRVRRSR